MRKFYIFITILCMFIINPIKSFAGESFDVNSFGNIKSEKAFKQGRELMLLCSYSGTIPDKGLGRYVNALRLPKENYAGAFAMYAVSSGKYFVDGLMAYPAGDAETHYNEGTEATVYNWGPLRVEGTNGDFYWDIKKRGIKKLNSSNTYDSLVAIDLNQYKFTLASFPGPIPDISVDETGKSHKYDIGFGVGTNSIRQLEGKAAVLSPIRRDLVEYGVCPGYAYVSVEDVFQGPGNHGITGFISHADDIMFANKEASGSANPNAVNDFQTVKIYQKFNNDKIYLFNGASSVSTVAPTECIGKDTFDKYYNLFDEMLDYTENDTLMTIYSNHNICNIAEAVSSKTSPESGCDLNVDLTEGVYDYEGLHALAKHVIASPACQDGETPIIDETKCDSYLGDIGEKGSPAYYLDLSFRFISYAAVAVLIITSIIDYIKCLSSNDKDALNKLNIKSVKRIIFTILLILLPYLLRIILPIFKITSDCAASGIGG